MLNKILIAICLLQHGFKNIIPKTRASAGSRTLALNLAFMKVFLFIQADLEFLQAIISKLRAILVFHCMASALCIVRAISGNI